MLVSVVVPVLNEADNIERTITAVRRLMRRETFERVGGFPGIPAMEDIEMMRALHEVGTVVRVPMRVTSSSRRFLERGVLRQMWFNVSVVVRYLFFGVTAGQIAREYYITRRDKR